MENDQLSSAELPFTRDQLVQKLKDALTDSRFHHVLRVEQTAMDLAKTNHVDVKRRELLLGS